MVRNRRFNRQSGNHQMIAYRTQSSKARKAKSAKGLRSIAQIKFIVTPSQPKADFLF